MTSDDIAVLADRPLAAVLLGSGRTEILPE
jgi:hypothetical protein